MEELRPRPPNTRNNTLGEAVNETSWQTIARDKDACGAFDIHFILKLARASRDHAGPSRVMDDG